MFKFLRNIFKDRSKTVNVKMPMFHGCILTKRPQTCGETITLASLLDECDPNYKSVYLTWDKLREFIRMNSLLSYTCPISSQSEIYWIHIMPETQQDAQYVASISDTTGVFNISPQNGHIPVKIYRRLEDDYINKIAPGIHSVSEFIEAIGYGYKRYVLEIVIPFYKAVLIDAGIGSVGADRFLQDHDLGDIIDIIDKYKDSRDNPDWGIELKKELMEYLIKHQ